MTRKHDRLDAFEYCQKLLLSLADDYVHENFTYDSSTNAWETRDNLAETYDEALRNAVDAIARAACSEFGHDWRRWNDVTRRCRRCEEQEHGEHLRPILADGERSA